jgi:hypothetical protein
VLRSGWRLVAGLLVGLLILWGAVRAAVVGEWLDAGLAGALGIAALGIAVREVRRLRRARGRPRDVGPRPPV